MATIFPLESVQLSQKPWELDTERRYRNHILFITDGSFSVRLIVYPAYLEFCIPIGDKLYVKNMHCPNAVQLYNIMELGKRKVTFIV